MAQAGRPFSVNEALRDLFQAHGVEARVQGEWVVFPASGRRAAGAIVREVEGPNSLTAQLDVQFEFTPGRTILESFAGLGASREAATADAFRNFVENSYHVLLAAFLRGNAFPNDDDQVSQETWRLGGADRRVTVGSLGVRGNPPVAGEYLVDRVKKITRRMERLALGPQTHWVRLYYCQAKGKPLACEALLDNQVWAAVQSEVAALAWPAADDFYSVRVFFVIHAQDGPGTRPKPSTWQFWKR